MRFACRHEDLRLYAFGFLEPAEAAVLESHLVDCADCRKVLAELQVESVLVAFELSLDTGESCAEPAWTAPRSRSSLGRILPVAVASAAVLLFVAVLLSVLWQRDVAPVPRAPEGPVAGDPGTMKPLPDPTALAAREEKADLLRRLAELEDEVRRLSESHGREAAVPPAEKMELAVERHDWAGLASALLGVAPDIAKGRMPGDPGLLRSYLEALEALRDLAEAVGTPATVKEAARDPRTGPFLFFAALRQSWPGAPEQDIETATRAAKTAMEEYSVAVAVAETPAERAVAETALIDALKVEVRKLTETQGPPTVKPVIESSAGSGTEEIDSGAATPIRPQEAAPVELVEPAETNDESTRLTVAVGTVLSSAGIAPVTDRIFRGTPGAVVAEVVESWQSEFGVPDRSAASLVLIAEGWVRSYRRSLDAAAPGVVRAFEARLGRGPAPRGVTEEDIQELRDALLALQVEAERRVLDLSLSARSMNSVRTFFLFD